MTSRYFPPFVFHSAAATKVSVECKGRHPSLTDTLQCNSTFRNTSIRASPAVRWEILKIRSGGQAELQRYVITPSVSRVHTVGTAELHRNTQPQT